MESPEAKVEAVLTLGWDAPFADVSGLDVIKGDPFPAAKAELVVGNCESLFQRCSDGYGPLKELVKRAPFLAKKTVRCHFNAFAYAFLKGAKNYDFLFPEGADSPYREIEKGFVASLSQLKSFEQLGGDFPSHLDKEVFLAVRKIFTRSSTREERWIPGELLLSGASTSGELAKILGTYDILVKRSLAQYLELGVITMNGDHATLQGKHLEIIYFFIRECLGIDPIEYLAR